MGDFSAVRYRYEPLPVFHCFRTLELLPGGPTDSLHGRLRVHANDPFVDYEAVSYVWGNPTLDHEIMIEGNPLRITSNLHSVLTRLRYVDKSRFLWADGICINQDDPKEKGKQVSRMGVYYQYAKNVLVYLGEDEDGSQDIPLLIDAIQAELPDSLNPGAWLNCALSGIEGIPPNDHKWWLALSKLFLRPWWKRYWIIQEVVKATRATIVCGSWTCEWDEFSQALRAVDTMEMSIVPAGSTPELIHGVKSSERNFINLVALRNSILRHMTPVRATLLDGTTSDMVLPHQVPSWNLIDILEKCRPAVASDPRDYIYAALGMSIEQAGLRAGAKDVQHLIPDYNEDVGTVYTRFSRYIVQWGDGIKVLYSACLGRENCSLDIPTWVPNWAEREVPWRPLAPRDDNAVNYHYSAATDVPSSLKVSTVSDYLVVKGYLVDTIDEVGSIADPERQLIANDPGGVFKRDLNIVGAAAKNLSRFLCKGEASQTDERIWRTLCCDVDDRMGNARAATEVGLDFEALMIFVQIWVPLQERRQPDPGVLSYLARFDDLMVRTKAFLMRSAPFCLGRRTAISRDKKLPAQVPAGAQSGDLIFVPAGSAVPLVMRPGLDGYELIGEAYVHGIMTGELLQSNTALDEVTIV